MSQALSRRALWMQKLSDEVVRSITERIRLGSLPVGADLGSRESLASEFVTSTGVIERAVEQLLTIGLVAERPDGGIRVVGFTPPDHGFEVPLSAIANIDDIVAILELRIGLEAVSSALAAERSNDEGMAAIRQAADDYERAATAGAGVATADFQFHRTIAQASGNQYLTDLLEYLGPLLIPRMRVRFPEARDGTVDGNLRTSVLEHRAIVEAIATGDADVAREAMRKHLSRTIELVRDIGRNAQSHGAENTEP